MSTIGAMNIVHKVRENVSAQTITKKKPDFFFNDVQKCENKII